MPKTKKTVKATGRTTTDANGTRHIAVVEPAATDTGGTALTAHCTCGEFTVPVASPAAGHQAVDNHVTDVSLRPADYTQEALL